MREHCSVEEEEEAEREEGAGEVDAAGSDVGIVYPG